MTGKIIAVTLIAAFLFNSAPAAENSPYQLNAKQDGIAAGGMGVLLLGGFLLENRVKAYQPGDVASLNREDVNSFDRSGTFHYSKSAGSVSYYTLYACMGAPFLLMADRNARRDGLTVGSLYLQTLALTNGLTSIAKGAAERTRPFVYNPDAPLSDKLAIDARKSFFSGHSSNAFASAVFASTVFSDYHPKSSWRWAVWGVSLSAAAATGALRYRAGKHFPTDILTGAAVGSAVGYLVPRLHRKTSADISLSLPAGSDVAGLVITHRF